MPRYRGSRRSHLLRLYGSLRFFPLSIGNCLCFPGNFSVEVWNRQSVASKVGRGRHRPINWWLSFGERMRWARRSAAMRAVALLIVSLWSVGASAAPTIDVRARTRLAIESVTRTGQGVHIHGSLTDALSSEGIAGRPITIGSEQGRTHATTGAGGRFDAYLDLGEGPHRLEARFADDAVYGEAVAAQTFDVDRAPLRLDLSVDRKSVV